MEGALAKVGRGVLPAVTILGVRVHRVGMRDALRCIERWIAERVPRMVITADANALVLAQEDSEFHALLQTADLVTPDGAGLLWAARRLGQPFPERVPGVELVAQLTRLSHEHGYRLYFVGAAPGVAQRAAHALLQAFPNAQIVGVHHGYFQPDEEPALLEQIRTARPDVLLVGMGMPRQEKWIARHKDSLGVPVSVGVGGSFDVYAGVVRRAPRWMQRYGLEWLWRLLHDPRKIAKVRNLPRFAWQVWRESRR
ncbi:MAG: WecB/TagA/CpsF family glycosyltransferase [Fimbriimonadales bacterium]|nr:WecB/TagA/CpsF family glycosyltransferase [Fimbriimonadales bacterium]